MATTTILRMIEKPGFSQTLHKVPIFSGLTETQLEFLTARIVEKKYGSGEIIFSEGDPCAGLYIVQAGNVRIYKSAASGREQVLAIEGPGSSIAELQIDGGRLAASIIDILEFKYKAFVLEKITNPAHKRGLMYYIYG